MKQALDAITMALVGSVVVALTCAGPATAEEDVRAALEAGNRKFEAAVSRGDGAALAALYTSDGQLLPAQSDVVTGTKAIGEFWQGVFDSGIKAATLTTIEVSSHGDTAHHVGRYELHAADGKGLDKGKYLVIWKKEGGTWKLHRDIWTTSVPPPQE